MNCIDCGSETEEGVCFNCATEESVGQMHDFNHGWAAEPDTCTACASEAAESEFNT